ncbi:MAG TPA: hypothetical protein VE258_00680, partial [Ktedonobacterales bacterium]|nr:hypothetical protein [Ktedonobacterales bacterium]
RASHARRLRAMPPRAVRWRRVGAYVAVAVVLALLIAGNVWAWGEAAAAARVPPVAVQLRAAQASLPFTIRQPGYLPQGLALTSVSAGQVGCATCGVSLTYQAPGGVRVTLHELPVASPGDLPTPPHYQPLPTPPNYQVSDVSVGGVHPIWWLGTETITERQINLAWSNGGMDYFLVSNGKLPLDTLKDIAASV